MFFCILLEDIIVPNKTSKEPKINLIFINSLKNIIPHVDPNRTCK